MRPFVLPVATMAWLLLAAPASADEPAGLRASGTGFRLGLPDGRRLTSADLVGAALEIDGPDGRPVDVRIDAVAPAPEQPNILLHSLSVRDARTGAWRPMCRPDARGRRAGFPVAGRWEGERYVKDAGRWFLTCTSGARGKCVLWGYDPWGRGPKGEDLAPFYGACQFMARADYDGRGAAHTRDGTEIEFWDAAGVRPAPSADPAFRFEAGWSPDGAVCVARTRWPALLPLRVLLESVPSLAGATCDEAEARRRGALLFNRSR